MAARRVVPKGGATISDVAAAAGVSRAAVSKVLRDAYGVSDEMRRRVNTVIAELGYRPRVSARAMRGSTSTIGVVLPHFGSQFFAEVMEGATAELRGSPYQFIVAPVDDAHHDSRRALEALHDRQVDGIIAISPLVEPLWLEEFAAHVPLVELGRHDESIGYDTVVGDDFQGTRQGMEHLLEQGHRRIAHMTHVDLVLGELTITPPAVRRAGYEAAMRAAGLAEQVDVIPGRFEEAPACRAMHAALDAGARPTAVFAGNDEAALGVLRAIAERGLTTADIAVLGYDDGPLARHPSVSLSTIHQDGVEMGRRSAALLVERIEGRTTAVHETHPTRLMTRDSTSGPAPDTATGIGWEGSVPVP
jgi:LacI family transcriptional regulator